MWAEEMAHRLRAFVVLQPSGTPVPGDPKPSSGTMHTYDAYKYTQAKNIK